MHWTNSSTLTALSSILAEPLSCCVDAVSAASGLCGVCCLADVGVGCELMRAGDDEDKKMAGDEGVLFGGEVGVVGPAGVLLRL